MILELGLQEVDLVSLVLEIKGFSRSIFCWTCLSFAQAIVSDLVEEEIKEALQIDVIADIYLDFDLFHEVSRVSWRLLVALQQMVQEKGNIEVSSVARHDLREDRCQVEVVVETCRAEGCGQRHLLMQLVVQVIRTPQVGDLLMSLGHELRDFLWNASIDVFKVVDTQFAGLIFNRHDINVD